MRNSMEELKDYKVGEETHIRCKFCGKALKRASWEGTPCLYVDPCEKYDGATLCLADWDFNALMDEAIQQGPEALTEFLNARNQRVRE